MPISPEHLSALRGYELLWRSDATDADGGTVVEIEHRGWERFGEADADRRDMNARGWSGVIPLYVAACRPGAARPE